jgi:hypothetical protein
MSTATKTKHNANRKTKTSKANRVNRQTKRPSRLKRYKLDTPVLKSFAVLTFNEFRVPKLRIEGVYDSERMAELMANSKVCCDVKAYIAPVPSVTVDVGNKQRVYLNEKKED